MSRKQAIAVVKKKGQKIYIKDIYPLEDRNNLKIEDDEMIIKVEIKPI
jgi:hypothetical protein